MTTEIQEKYPFVRIGLCNGRNDVLIMQTSGLQFIYQVVMCGTELKYLTTMEQIDQADRMNMVQVPGQWAFMKTAGNMQYIRMAPTGDDQDIMGPDDVYAAVMAVKREAAQWVSEHWSELTGGK